MSVCMLRANAELIVVILACNILSYAYYYY